MENENPYPKMGKVEQHKIVEKRIAKLRELAYKLNPPSKSKKFFEEKCRHSFFNASASEYIEWLEQFAEEAFNAGREKQVEPNSGIAHTFEDFQKWLGN